MRYSIVFDRIVNQLVPYMLRGRKLILFLQAMVHPLQKLNDDFVEWAKETKIEASMTSQIGKFEWFLNHKFSKYFLDSSSKITLQTYSRLGAELHWENSHAIDVRHSILRKGEENIDPNDTMILYHEAENEAEGNVSFIVNSPEVNETLISKEQYIALLKYQVNKYKLASKTFSIKYNNDTL